MSIDLETGLGLIIKAKTEERDARIFQQWVTQLPLMATADAYISYEDYRDRLTGANIDRRSDAEILAEIDEIERQFAEKGGADNVLRNL